jgi:hypothetical protein
MAGGDELTLGVIRQSKVRTQTALGSVRRFESEGAGNGSNSTVLQLSEKSFARQIADRRSPQTLGDDRWQLNAFSRGMGEAKAAAGKRSDIHGYLEAIAPGTNRRSYYESIASISSENLSNLVLRKGLRSFSHG